MSGPTKPMSVTVTRNLALGGMTLTVRVNGEIVRKEHSRDVEAVYALAQQIKKGQADPGSVSPDALPSN